jgi:hypothetical protein
VSGALDRPAPTVGQPIPAEVWEAREEGVVDAGVYDTRSQDTRYRDLQDAVALSVSPTSAIQRACGDYIAGELDGGSAAATLKLEEARFVTYETCADGVIKNYDMNQRSAELAEFAIHEERLTRLSVSRPERMVIPSADAEMISAKRVVYRAYQDYQARVGEISQTATTGGGMRLETGSNEILVGPNDFKLGGDLNEGLPGGDNTGADRGRTSDDSSGPPLSSQAFLTRLLPDGANMDVGPGGSSCVSGLSCEVGKIVPLLAVRAYCETPGQVTETTAGWALVVQRYQPQTRAQEMSLMIPAEGSTVHALAANDTASLTAGLAEMRQESVSAEGDPIFFTSWHDYFMINGQEKGCGDAWRDAGQHKVANNRL